MRSEIITIRHLVKALDDSMLFCHRVHASVTHSSLRYLLERVAETHQRIADGLCEQIAAAGGRVSRKGLTLRLWRVAWSRWLARTSSDFELAYASQTMLREERLLRKFRSALQRTCDHDARSCLAHRLYELERAQAQIRRVVSLMDIQANVSLVHDPAAVRIPTAAAVRRPTAQERSRFDALPPSTGVQHHGCKP